MFTESNISSHDNMAWLAGLANDPQEDLRVDEGELPVGSPCTFTVLYPVWGFDFEGPGCQATDILEKAGNSPGRKWLRCRRPASVMPALMRL